VQTLLTRKESPGTEPEKRQLARDLLVDALVVAGTTGGNAEEAKRVIAEKAGVSAVTVWRAFGELKGEGLAAGQPNREPVLTAGNSLTRGRNPNGG
jgi:DNA-binding GntR family transcriptional regulator